MTLAEHISAASETLKWRESKTGWHELALLSAKYGFSDGWFIVHAIRKVTPAMTRYEDICAVVNELRILRRQPAIRARVEREAIHV